MRHTFALSAAALALVALAPTARAQSTTASASAAAPAAAAAPVVPWSTKSAGTYDIVVAGANDGNSESATLVIGTDSTGALTAKVVEGPRNDEHPMTVEVKGDDLVMKSQTNNGVMTITVQRRGDEIAGHWEIGSQQGTLTGKLHS